MHLILTWIATSEQFCSIILLLLRSYNSSLWLHLTILSPGLIVGANSLAPVSDLCIRPESSYMLAPALHLGQLNFLKHEFITELCPESQVAAITLGFYWSSAENTHVCMRQKREQSGQHLGVCALLQPHPHAHISSFHWSQEWEEIRLFSWANRVWGQRGRQRWPCTYRNGQDERWQWLL